jgi:hypothetical protein
MSAASPLPDLRVSGVHMVGVQLQKWTRSGAFGQMEGVSPKAGGNKSDGRAFALARTQRLEETECKGAGSTPTLSSVTGSRFEREGT